jgi:hypothetical protein
LTGVQQGCVLHACTMLLEPAQGAPPHEGAGLLQYLVPVCVPPPQVSEQGDQT